LLVRLRSYARTDHTAYHYLRHIDWALLAPVTPRFAERANDMV
jgi:hypothetical protein